MYIRFKGCDITCFRSSYKNLANLDEKERQRQDRNDIRSLHLLRTLIHNQVMLVDPSLREEGQDPALYRMLVDVTYETILLPCTVMTVGSVSM